MNIHRRERERERERETLHVKATSLALLRSVKNDERIQAAKRIRRVVE